LKAGCLANPVYSPPKTARRNFNMLNMALKQRLSYGRKRQKFTGKERDAETGLYYYGARYLDPKTGRWLSGDPAMGEYLPSSGQEAGKLPGQGGVFNYVNLHSYHYAGNNPVKYADPDGEQSNNWPFGFGWEDYMNFWGPVLGKISAFFGYKPEQNNITLKGQYYLKVFDKAAITALTKVSEASSIASLTFLAAGQPEAAAAASGVSLVAEGMLFVHDWVSAFQANDPAGMNKAVNNATFLVAGLIIGDQTGKAVSKALSITADGKTINCMITGNNWKDIQRTIRNEFGNLSGSVLEGILSAAKEAYDK